MVTLYPLNPFVAHIPLTPFKKGDNKDHIFIRFIIWFTTLAKYLPTPVMPRKSPLDGGQGGHKHLNREIARDLRI